MISSANNLENGSDDACYARHSIRVRARRSQGFSLVEVLVAIVILTVGVVAFLQVFPPGFLGLKEASDTANADRIAQATLEQLLSNHSSNIEEIAAINTMYQDPGDADTVGMVGVDPAFNPDKALNASAGPNGLPLVSLTAASTGFNVPNTPVPANGTPTVTEQYQYIKGEKITIPLPTSITQQRANGQAGDPIGTTNFSPTDSNVLLNFGPILIPSITGSSYQAIYPGPTDTRDPLSTSPNFYHSLDNNETPAFFVHGTPWSRVVGNSLPFNYVAPSGSTPFTQTDPYGTAVAQDDPDVELTQDASQYMIDYTNQAIALRVPTFSNTGLPNNGEYNQTFQMKYSYVDTGVVPNVVKTDYTWFRACWPKATGDSDTHDIDFYTETSPTGTTVLKSHWVPLTALNLGNDSGGKPRLIVANSEVITRDFQYMTSATTFDNDPYEFAVSSTSQLSTDPSGNSIYLGQLQFNPLIATLVGAHGASVQATVDYIASDWHTIHEDRTVGAQSNVGVGTLAPSTSRLTFNHLLQVGGKDQIGNAYSGYRGPGGTAEAVVVFDLDTFEELVENTDYTVDYANGSITFPSYPAGAHVRIFYKPTYDWGVTVLKPAASYSVVSLANNTVAGTPTTTPQSVGEVVDDDSANPGVIYFPTCDSGRQVQVDGTITYTSGGSPTTTTISQLVTVEPTTGISAIGSVPVQISPVTIPNGATNVSENLNIVGASMTVRVVWREQANWRHTDVTALDIPSSPAT